MARYVASIVVEGTTLFFFDQCGDVISEIDLCPIIAACEGSIPIEDDPGEFPDPYPSVDTRCRVALDVGEIAATRLDNYLDGLNLNSSIANFVEAYVTAKITEYVWPIGVYGALRTFTYTLWTGGGAGRGLDAENDYTTSPTDDIFNSREALFCALPDSAVIDTTVREIWALGLEATASPFELLLADFLRVWPLDDLRTRAFNASLGTGVVDCSAFDCEGGVGDCGDTLDALFEGQSINDYGFTAITTGTTDDFPGFEPVGGVKNLDTIRTVEGFKTSDPCGGGDDCEACAIQLTYAQPFTLCSLEALGSKLAQDRNNTRILAIYAKETGSSVWSMLARDQRGIGAQPTVLTVQWTGVMQVDAIAAIMWSGGGYARIKHVTVNP